MAAGEGRRIRKRLLGEGSSKHHPRVSPYCALYQIPAACSRTCAGQSPGTPRFLRSLSGAAWVRVREGSSAPSGELHEGAVYKVGVEGAASEGLAMPGARGPEEEQVLGSEGSCMDLRQSAVTGSSQRKSYVPALTFFFPAGPCWGPTAAGNRRARGARMQPTRVPLLGGGGWGVDLRGAWQTSDRPTWTLRARERRGHRIRWKARWRTHSLFAPQGGLFQVAVQGPPVTSRPDAQ